MFIANCSGYEPIFSTKDLRFYIDEIENIDNGKITKQIVRNIRSYKLDNNKNKYSLKISSENKNVVTSKDPKGNALTYRVTIVVKIDVFEDNQNLILNTINIKKGFTYNYQINQFELNQYKESIIENLIVKISEEIILELQLL
jgi:outer membrane lipopolysaccharide assembly protein LptE/RlpB